MLAALDALAIALYVEIDDVLQPRHGPGRPPRLSDAELITLAVCQVFLGLPNDRKFLALARYRLGHLFPTLIDQSGYNRRLRALAPQIARAINYLTFTSPSFYDNLRLLDSTAGPCGQSRETARRSEFAGYAGYGYCRSHSRFFWASGSNGGLRRLIGKTRAQILDALDQPTHTTALALQLGRSPGNMATTLPCSRARPRRHGARRSARDLLATSLGDAMLRGGCPPASAA